MAEACMHIYNKSNYTDKNSSEGWMGLNSVNNVWLGLCRSYRGFKDMAKDIQEDADKDKQGVS